MDLRLGLVLAAALSLAGPAAHAPAIRAQEATPAACPAMTAGDTAALASAFMDRLNAHDTAGIADLIAPGGIYLSATQGLEAGPAGVKAALDRILAPYPDAVHETDARIVDGDIAIIRWTAQGTNTGVLAGREPTGEARAWTGMFQMRGECGEIVEIQSAVDQAAYFGLVPGEERRIASPAPAATPASCAPMSPAEMREAVVSFWADGWNGHDVSVYRALVAPDVIHRWTSGDDTEGADAGAARLAGFFEAIPGIEILWREIAVEGDLAGAAWTLKGMDEGGLFGAPPTGRAIEYDGINVFRFACGKIAEVWSEGDIRRLQAQLAE